jgi:hypothetical protein
MASESLTQGLVFIAMGLLAKNECAFSILLAKEKTKHFAKKDVGSPCPRK